MTAHQPQSSPRRRTWYVYGVLTLLGFLLGHALFTYLLPYGLFQTFRVSIGSMEPTLHHGDYIIVDTIRYHRTLPQRFDVVVFTHPQEHDKAFVKRIIGLPGERVDIRGRQVSINGQPLTEPERYYASGSGHEEDFGPVIVPKRDDVIEMRHDTRLYINDILTPLLSVRYYPGDHGAAEARFEAFYRPLFPAGRRWRQPSGPHTVPEDHYFVLGDNREKSHDSRYWGCVPHSYLRGRAARIYWSWDNRAQSVRWQRLGQGIP